MSNTETEFENITLVGKLTLAALGLEKPNLQEVVREAKGPVEIAQFLAFVDSYSEKASKLNPENMDAKFVGNFEGTNVLDGSMARSNAMYVPGVAQAFLKKVVDNAGAGSTTGIVFVITVQKDPAPNSATGYKFGVKAVTEKTGADPFAGLRAKLAASRQGAIAAPGKKK